ncbi:MAG: hypothetical protein ACPLW6_01835 [Desulfurella sp.]|jgi:hypothetical protein|uniref:Uncharacterized protein n=1 Tax=Desulfurella multipotens TaxID=79269 RepID=A0A1G6KUX2_9BACT|nr:MULTISPECIES: hypothetical protein [Desulfurella]AHF97750.1 hypothetical protein DESACE_02365 [Desulfurella acetivorans A63]HEX13603.1 hypothetical protein [Desulfurella acetivorans]PMP62957.1 MAG: hypothetical protein C0192_08235 [Desulfurella multipotens]PMP87430.1 MAG: hypothetical protein C0173_09120 [Desulfurella sp.]SDC34295.1 hypothetical protein SAMN05660835_00687 [Desulfurella multipotens]
MDGKSDSFDIAKELDLRGKSENEAYSILDGTIKSAQKGKYVLAYVNEYDYISKIAQKLSQLGAYIENVLKKNEHDFVIMIKNDVKQTQNA